MVGNNGLAVAGAEVDGIHGAESVGDKAEAGDKPAGGPVVSRIGGDAVDGNGHLVIFGGEGQSLPASDIGPEAGEVMGLAVQEVVAELGDGLAGTTF